MEEKKKKQNTKKETQKTIKKVKRVKREKNAVPNNEPMKEKIKRFISSYSFLYTVFVFLLVLVIFLFIYATVKKNEKPEEPSNIVFSIMEKNTNNYINIELDTLVGNTYALKVSNHRNGVVNKNGAEYYLTIINNSEAEIEVHQDENMENLMKDQKQTTIQGVPFSTKEKEETIFYFQVKEGSEVKKGDTLRIEVKS